MKISVIIPAWNRQNVIGDALRSVLAQTYLPHEVIIVDDGSVDQTRQEIQILLGELQPSIPVYYVFQENGGPASARNNGMAQATGEWIAFLDSDDKWHPEKLAVQVRAIEETGASFIFTKFEDRPSYRMGVNFPAPTGKARSFIGSPSEIFRQKVILTSSVMFNRAYLPMIGPFDTSLRISEDWDWFLRFGEHRFTCAEVSDILVHRRRHSANAINDRMGCHLSFMRVLERWQDRLEREVYAPLMAENRNDLAGLYIREMKLREAREQLHLCSFGDLPLKVGVKAMFKLAVLSVLAPLTVKRGEEVVA